MPKIPSRETVTPELLVNNLQHTSTSVRNRFKDLARVIAERSISATALGSICGDLSVLRRALAETKDHPHIVDFAVKKFGPEYETIPDDLHDLIQKLDQTIAAIQAMVPSDKNGNLLIVKWDTDGTFAWRSFTPEQLEPLRLLVTEIAGSIDGKE